MGHPPEHQYSYIDGKDLRIIISHQSAEIKVFNLHGKTINIRRGERQGCILSLLLINIYSEQIFREALEEA